MENGRNEQLDIGDMATMDLRGRLEELRVRMGFDKVDEGDLRGARTLLSLNKQPNNDKVAEEIVRGTYRAEIICIEAELQERIDKSL